MIVWFQMALTHSHRLITTDCSNIFLYSIHFRYCRNEWRKTLASLIGKQDLLIQMKALGLVGKFITGPWMTVFYKNDFQLSNLEMVCFTFI